MTKKKTTTKKSSTSSSSSSGMPEQAAQYVKQAQRKAAEKKQQAHTRAVAARFAPQAAAEKAEKRTYVVKSGDSLSKIAGELLGDVMRWPEIYEANKDQIENPDLIHPGQKLIIPRK